MAIRDDYIAGELVTAAAKNEENTALIAAALGKPTFDLPVAWNVADSSTRGVSSTSDFYFDGHVYTIPAGKLIAERAYRFDAWVLANRTAGDLGMWFRLGGATKVGNLFDFNITSNMGTGLHIQCTVFGTDVAGASKTVRVVAQLDFDDGTLARAFHKFEDIAAIATNGDLLFECGGHFNTSHGGNSMIMKTSIISALAKTAIAS